MFKLVLALLTSGWLLTITKQIRNDFMFTQQTIEIFVPSSFNVMQQLTKLISSDGKHYEVCFEVKSDVLSRQTFICVCNVGLFKNIERFCRLEVQLNFA